MGIVTTTLYDKIFLHGINILGENRKLIAIDSLISGIIGLVIYFILIILFDIKEAKELLYTIKSKIKNKK